MKKLEILNLAEFAIWEKQDRERGRVLRGASDNKIKILNEKAAILAEMILEEEKKVLAAN